jgi:hypothetical protein
MIDFVLATEMKAAGFPQPDIRYGLDDSKIASDRGFNEAGERITYDNCCGFWRDCHTDGLVYEPTLSELIEAVPKSIDKERFSLVCLQYDWFAMYTGIGG